MSEILAGKYRLLQELARGGMGVVWLAQHLGSEVHVAAKLILNANEANLGRFRREVFVSQRIQHPGVIRVHDSGVLPGGQAYMVMHLLRGVSLRERLELDGPQSAPICLDLLEQLLEALQAVHQAGVVHRDLKPDNLHLEPDPSSGNERVTLVDFGVSRLLDEEVVESEQLYVSVEGVLSGTPHYVAPEALAQPGTVSTAHDVYACGVIFYELLTGRLPYPPSNSLQQILENVVDLAIPSLDSACPMGAPFAPGYEWLVRKLLEKDEHVRPQDASAALALVREARERIAREAARQDAPQQPPRDRGISGRFRRLWGGGE
ncbi:MAG: serine/threonine protein kinase [Planctomycetes bacterium]|nr:serine/threonine protein kinase [Planctomycetota bacterium]